MFKVLRVWSGSYHDYWFTDDAILKVRLVPQTITLFGIVALIVLTFLLGISGLIIGAVIAGLIYLASGRLAGSRRGRIGSMSPQEIQQKGLVTLRIPYSVISEAEIKEDRLTLSIDGRKVRVRILEEDRQALQTILSSKLGNSFISDG